MLAHAAGAHAGLPIAELITGGVEIIDRLAGEWRGICDAGPYTAPFYRPEWVSAYMSAFAADEEVVLVTVRQSGRLIAVLPLVSGMGTLGGLPVRKLRAPANVHTCRYDLVHCETASAAMVVPVIWDALCGLRDWDVLEMPNVPFRGTATDLAKHARTQGYTTYAVRGSTSPYLKLPGDDTAADSPVQCTDAKFRSNLRRRMRILQSHGTVKVVCSEKRDERLFGFYELERSGWKGKERSAIACSDETRDFYDAVASSAERFGYFALYTLECAGRAVAMHYGVRHSGRFFLLKTAYDENFAACSPGQLLTYEVLRSLTAQRYTEFDFLGLNMPWKRAWMPRLRTHSSWYVFRGKRGGVARALRFGIRPALGRYIRRGRRAAAETVANARA